MLGETFAIVHLLLVEVQDVLHDLPHDGCPWWFRIVLVLVLQLLLPSRIDSLDQAVFTEVRFLELR